MADFLIDSLRGGLNLVDPAAALPKDACTVANNVEFFKSTLGERRLGCTAITLPAALLTDPNMEAVSAGYRHLPTNTESDAELWVLGQKMDGSVCRLFRNTFAGGWSEVTFPTATAGNFFEGWPVDTPVATGLLDMRFQSLHGKLFIAYKNLADRLHVWDGTTFRRAGLHEPAVPTVANGAAFVSTYAQVVASDGATAYWRLDETSAAAGQFTNSLAGAGHEYPFIFGGKTTAGAGITFGVAGPLADAHTAIKTLLANAPHDAGYGGFLLPDAVPGDNGTIDTNNAVFYPSGGIPGSIEFWVKPSAETVPGVGDFQALLTMNGGLFAIGFLNVVGGIRVAYANLAAGVIVADTANNTALTTGAFHHVVFTLDGAGNHAWYLDGVLDGTAGTFAAITNRFSPYLILDSDTNALPLYVSALSDVAVYKGIALTATQVLTHFNKQNVAGSGGAPMTGARTYRVRYTKQVAGVTVLRSEPSDAVSFTPDGTHKSITVTRPALVNEGETHWELEASLDGSTFYVIATTVVGTTTADDTTAFATGYAAFTQSEPIGTYTTIPSCRLLTVDEDRLMVGGSNETTGEDSWVQWTPVGTDPSPGQDERLNATTDPQIDLDGREGGALTELSRALNGTLMAFKASHIYRVLRTGQLVGAYDAICITKARGALAHSVVEASDEGGRPALYFIDPLVGAMRIGASGLQACGADIRPLWRRMNIDGARPCHGVYYSSKLQVHWWVALDGASTPNWKVVLQTNELRSTPDLGARRGWSVVPAPARIASALCSIMFDPAIDGSAARSRQLVPFIGKQEWTV